MAAVSSIAASCVIRCATSQASILEPMIGLRRQREVTRARKTKDGSRACLAGSEPSPHQTRKKASQSKRASSSPGPGCREASAIAALNLFNRPSISRSKGQSLGAAVSGLPGGDRLARLTAIHARIRCCRSQSRVALQRHGTQVTRLGGLSRSAVSRLPQPHVLRHRHRLTRRAPRGLRAARAVGGRRLAVAAHASAGCERTRRLARSRCRIRAQRFDCSIVEERFVPALVPGAPDHTCVLHVWRGRRARHAAGAGCAGKRPHARRRAPPLLGIGDGRLHWRSHASRSTHAAISAVCRNAACSRCAGWSPAISPARTARRRSTCSKSLGGGETLRGFHSYRFPDQALAHVSVEYRWRAHIATWRSRRSSIPARSRRPVAALAGLVQDEPGSGHSRPHRPANHRAARLGVGLRRAPDRPRCRACVLDPPTSNPVACPLN